MPKLGEPVPPRPGGQGLRNMQERALAVGGTMRYHPSAPSGRTVVVQLPW